MDRLALSIFAVRLNFYKISIVQPLSVLCCTNIAVHDFFEADNEKKLERF